jgi:hypothetical protein
LALIIFGWYGHDQRLFIIALATGSRTHLVSLVTLRARTQEHCIAGNRGRYEDLRSVQPPVLRPALSHANSVGRGHLTRVAQLHTRSTALK